MGNGIGNHARLVAQRELAGVIRGEIDGHIDVLEIEDGQNALACSDDLAGAGEPVLHPPAPGRDEHQINQDRLEPLNIGLGCLDRGLGLIALRLGRNIHGLGRFELVASLVHGLLRYIPVLYEKLPALIIGSGKIQVALALSNERDSFRQCPFGLQHLRLGGAQLGFGFRRRDGGNHLSSRDLVAFVHGQRRQPARIFRRDVDLRGLDAAVRFHDPLGHVAAPQAIDQRFYRRAGFFDRVLLCRLGLRSSNKRAAS